MKHLLTLAAALAASFSLQAQSLEIPSGEYPDTQVVSHTGYTACFSFATNTPLWVAWQLTADEAGADAASRTDEFLPDPLLGDRSPVTWDYSRSGWDRGHMAPAADFKWSPQAMSESFYMSNICPQDHTLNGAGPWLGLEKQTRVWTKHYRDLWLAAGPVFSSDCSYIGNEHRIAIPDAFYKVILKQFRDTWYAIGFLMPNRPVAGEGSFFEYAVSVDTLESLTGLDFFPSLPDGIEETAEASFDVKDWSYYLIPFKK